MATTHQSAIVVIPPAEVWEPIQRIRRVHDRQLRRWMPHITLLYPFVPRDALRAEVPVLERVCSDIAPFEIELTRFDRFVHRLANFTVWLAPEPAEPLVQLQAALAALFPHCNAVARFGGGFRPHLSVGQARGEDGLATFQDAIAEWRPLRFAIDAVHVIVRGPPPDDVFTVAATVPLGAVPEL